MENYRQLSAKLHLISKRLVSCLLTTFLFSTDTSPVYSPSQLLSGFKFPYYCSSLLSRHMSFVEIFNEYNNQFSSKFSFVFLKEVGHPTTRRKKPGLQHRVWVSHFTLAYMEERTYGRRSVGRTHDVITKPKFLAQNLLAMGLRARAPSARAELR